ncbi:hypothetical protein A1O1_05689 [Capronia coronata CBS 617.96]|uniref:alpha-L-rhamnosidase n=1 Tax=Capronia coronata CBS 617.96 TaxID=1182541 RepID=W9Y6R9_9EURO|nr:uncharacterized protein A1O1_05689 [Capronia coronata CBS 617.96]EXJ85325.1 hypothetical protein A1O1_05689 [Capronia coronata CBS 617.96]
MTAPTPSPVTFEHHHSSLGIGCSRPRLSWKFLYGDKTAKGWIQTGYELEVKPSTTGNPTSYPIKSDQSTLVAWPGEHLKSRTSATVRVRCFGKSSETPSQEQSTPWSEPSTVETGLLERSDWTASFIASTLSTDCHGTLRPVRFWKSVDLENTPTLARARLYITALGVFNVYINGQLASDECMAPGWTSYKHRLNYRVLDVSALLVPNGRNVVGVEVAEGWYAGRLGFKGGKRFYYGEDLAVLAQLEIGFSDSSTQTVVSDETWNCYMSALQSSGIYDGEVYDHREETEWTDTEIALKANTSCKVRSISWPSSQLVLPDAPPVRVIESRAPENIFHSKSGKVIIDFGQNLVGKLLVKSLQLPAGHEVIFKHAEVMEHGELGTRPLRGAKARDIIIGSGGVMKDWTPKYTFHGFRYVQIEGWPGVPDKSEISALVMHSDMKRRGYFHCSNASVNRLHQNVVWSMKGNFLSIPTDCPQRDERLGWTGDIQVFSSTALFLYDSVGLLGNWMEDVAAEQLEEGKGGIPPLVVPDVLPPNWPHMPQAVWDDVVVLTPETLFDYSADKAILQRQFASMRAWLDEGIDRAADGLWNNDRWQLADWLDPAAPSDDPGAARTDNIMVANAYLIRVTEAFSRICGLLGKDDLARTHAEDAARLKARFQYKYITAEGNLMSCSQTGISLAIQGGLYKNQGQLQVAAASLDKLVRYGRFRIATGFAGTPVITHALTAAGYPQLAYRMLLEKKCPSWMYPVTMGATTIWERWDSMLPNGDINPGQMTSFNHYALGAVADWLHTTVGGIMPLDPGWKVIGVRPIPGGNLTSADVSFDGPFGQVACSWQWKPENGRFNMVLRVPPNSTAVVTLPSETTPRALSVEEEGPRCVVGSGVHEFSCDFDAGQWPPNMLVASNQSVPPDEIAT